MQEIVVGFDGSDEARDALRLGSLLSRATSGELVLAAVCPQHGRDDTCSQLATPVLPSCYLSARAPSLTGICLRGSPRPSLGFLADRANTQRVLYELAEVGLEVGIVLASVSIVARRRWLLGIGGAASSAGVVLLVVGLLH